MLQLSALLRTQPEPIDPSCGQPSPFKIAIIDEAHCIGCTLCIAACPVDAIVGANKRMHTVITAACTGCDLCLPACPVDCIEMVIAPPELEWTTQRARTARERYVTHQTRLATQAKQADTPVATPIADKAAIIDSVMARIKARRATQEDTFKITS